MRGSVTVFRTIGEAPVIQIKRGKKVYILGSVIFIIALVFVLRSFISNSCQELEHKIPSPNGKYEIVVKVSDCGAITSTTMSVYIIKKGSNVSYFDEQMLLADRYGDLELEWDGNDGIKVIYDKARIHKFSNNWMSLQNGAVEDEINLELVKKQ